MRPIRRAAPGRHRVIELIAVGTACLAAGACEGGPGPAGDALTVTDSAGVRVVDVRWEAARDAADTITLSEPLTRVGVIEGDRDYQNDRVVAVVPLAEGRFAVCDAGRHDLRVFDAEGGFLSRVGSEGEGPGELRAITLAFSYRGDSVAVFDALTGRVTVFPTSEGRPRSFLPRVEGEGLRVRVDGSLGDGRFVAERGMPDTAPDALRAELTVWVYSPDGEPLGPLGPFVGSETFRREGGGIVMAHTVPWPLRTFVAGGRGDVLVADAVTAGFTRWRPEGTLAEAWRTDEPRQPLDPAIAEAHRDSLLENNRMPGDWAELWAEGIRALPYPDSIPVYSDFRLGLDGSVWLERERLGEAVPVWAVVHPDGHVARFVRTQPGASLMTVTDTRAYVVATDELGVEYVEVHALPAG